MGLGGKAGRGSFIFIIVLVMLVTMLLFFFFFFLWEKKRKGIFGGGARRSVIIFLGKGRRQSPGGLGLGYSGGATKVPRHFCFVSVGAEEPVEA